VTEVERPNRLPLDGASVITSVERSLTVWNEGRRFSADLLSVRSPTVDRTATQTPLSGRGRPSTASSRPPAVLQTSQRRPSQPTPCRALRQLPGNVCGRRCSDNDVAACSSCIRKRRNELETNAYPRRQSVQSNPPASTRDQRLTSRRLSEGQGVTQLNTWWTKSAKRPSRDRQTEPLEQPDRKLPPWAMYCKRRSAPDVAFSKRRASTSSGRQTTDEQMTDRREMQQADAARRRRWNAAASRLADDSFDSVLMMSDLPSPTDTLASDYGSAGSLSDIARGRRKDSGFRSIETQSSYGASRKSSTSTSGMRRQSIQTTTDVATGRHNSIPFVANPFELPNRSSRRPVPAGPRMSGRRQSMFTRSDEVGSSDSGWLNEWLRWRSGCSDVELPDFQRQALSTHHGTGVWNSLTEKVERTFDSFDRVLSRATALLHDRRISSDAENHVEF